MVIDLHIIFHTSLYRRLVIAYKLMHGFPIWLRVTFLCEPTIILPVYQKWEVLHLKEKYLKILLFPAFFPQISLIYTLYWFELQWKEQQSLIDNPIGGGSSLFLITHDTHERDTNM